MRKVKLSKDTEVTIELVNDLIEKHQTERARILEMKKYYNGQNPKIMNREYKQRDKPQNRLIHSYASYITDNFVGYMVGQPISYKSDNEDLLNKFNESFIYNDEIDNNTTLAQEQSVCGYSYELLYRDEDANVRFRCVDTEDVIVVYDDTLEEKELFVIRYIVDDKGDGTCYLYTKELEQIYSMKSLKINMIESQETNYFSDVPVCTYENNRQRIGDFEKVISLIDAYDQANSDTANDFEYFTDALLVISGMLIDEVDSDGKPINFKENKVLNFQDSTSRAEYLIKNINDTALENYKNRLKSDIHKFANVVDLTDEKFAGNLSGVALKFKLQGMENLTAIKESKFRKGLMKRIELLSSFFNIKNNSLYTYTDIVPVFTRNIPSNELETVNMVKSLYGIISDKTLLSQIPFVEDVQAEFKALEKQKKDNAINDYEQFNESDTNQSNEDEEGYLNE